MSKPEPIFEMVVRELEPPPAHGERLLHRGYDGVDTQFVVASEPEPHGDGWLKFRTDPIIKTNGVVEREGAPEPPADALEEVRRRLKERGFPDETEGRYSIVSANQPARPGTITVQLTL